LCKATRFDSDMSRTKALMMRCMPMMVTCKEADQFIDDYLSDELPRKQRLVFEWHVRLCTGCKDYLERYRRSIDLCRRSFYDTDTGHEEEIPEQIIKGIMAAKRSTKE